MIQMLAIAIPCYADVLKGDTFVEHMGALSADLQRAVVQRAPLLLQTTAPTTTHNGCHYYPNCHTSATRTQAYTLIIFLA